MKELENHLAIVRVKFKEEISMGAEISGQSKMRMGIFTYSQK